MKISVKKVFVSSVVIILLTFFLYLGFTFYKVKTDQVYFDNLDEAFSNEDHVEVLILRNQHLKTLPTRIEKFKNLKVLNLANNALEYIPQGIGNLTKLEELILDHNQLKTLPPSIRQLKNLKKIDLSHNLFTNIPQGLSQLDSLTTLTFSNNQLTEVLHIKGFRGLRILDLAENEIEDVSPQISQLQTLVKLDLYNNKLKKIPQALFSMPVLRELILSGNELNEETTRHYSEFIINKSNLSRTQRR